MANITKAQFHAPSASTPSPLRTITYGPAWRGGQDVAGKMELMEVGRRSAIVTLRIEGRRRLEGRSFLVFAKRTAVLQKFVKRK